MNIKELVQFCKEIKGKTHKEALKIGDKHGVSHCGVDALRKILGYSDGSRINKLSPEERDRIADEYREGGVTIISLARKHGVTFNAVRCLLLSRNVTIFNPHQYTRRQEMFIQNELRRGTSVKKIAEAIGKSEHCIKLKIERMGAKA